MEAQINILKSMNFKKLFFRIWPIIRDQEKEEEKISEAVAETYYIKIRIWSYEGHIWNIAKGTTDPRVEFILQVLRQILTKFHLQNLKQLPTSKSNKVKFQIIDQT